MRFRRCMGISAMQKTITIILVLACTALLLLALKIDAENEQTTGLYGRPVKSVEESPLSDFNINLLADDSQCLYLLDELNGVLLVYDVDGTYKHTMSFYNTLNGAFRMVVQQDVLYVQDSRDNIYVLRFGEFERFIKMLDQATSDKVDFNKNTSNYTLRGDGVYKNTEHGEICVIPRPIQSVVYNEGWALLLLFALFVMVAIYRLTGKHTRHRA